MSSFPPPPAAKHLLEEGSDLTPRFDEKGLVTCVTVDAAKGDVVMLAHMNDKALRLTLETGIAHYYSRSRQRLWKKGETSGALQHVREIRVDCDQDAVLLTVDIEKPEETCHTGRRSCFYRAVDRDTGKLRPAEEG